MIILPAPEEDVRLARAVARRPEQAAAHRLALEVVFQPVPAGDYLLEQAAAYRLERAAAYREAPEVASLWVQVEDYPQMRVVAFLRGLAVADRPVGHRITWATFRLGRGSSKNWKKGASCARLKSFVETICSSTERCPLSGCFTQIANDRYWDAKQSGRSIINAIEHWVLHPVGDSGFTPSDTSLGNSDLGGERPGFDLAIERRSTEPGAFKYGLEAKKSVWCGCHDVILLVRWSWPLANRIERL